MPMGIGGLQGERQAGSEGGAVGEARGRMGGGTRKAAGLEGHETGGMTGCKGRRAGGRRRGWAARCQEGGVDTRERGNRHGHRQLAAHLFPLSKHWPVNPHRNSTSPQRLHSVSP